jgi:hypothetical protein
MATPDPFAALRAAVNGPQVAPLPPNQLIPTNMAAGDVLSKTQGADDAFNQLRASIGGTQKLNKGLITWGPRMNAFAQGIGSTVPKLPGYTDTPDNVLLNPQGKLAQAYLPAMQQIQQQNTADIGAHPYINAAGKLAGATAVSMGPMEGVGGAADLLLPAAKGIMGDLARRSAIGALEGGTFGLVPQPQAGQTRLGNTISNAVVGGAAAPVLGAVGLAGNKVLGGLGSMGKKMLMPTQSAKNTVRDIIADSRLGSSNLPMPVTGAKFSLGGSTLDPGIQSLEQAVRARNVEGLSNEAVFQAQMRQNNAGLTGKLNAMHNPKLTPEESSTLGHTALQNARDTMGNKEDILWGEVPGDADINIPHIYNAARNWYDGLTVSEQRALGKSGINPMDDLSAIQQRYGIQAPFNEIKTWRSGLSSDIRDANPNTARLLRQLDKRVMDTLGSGQGFTGQETEAAAAYNPARFYTSDIHNKYFTPDVEKWLTKDPAKLLHDVTSTPAKMDAYLNAASQATDQGVAAKEALRNYLIGSAKGASQMSARGGDTPFINGQSLEEWLTDKKNVLGKVFQPNEIQNLHDIAQGAYRNIASEAASPRVGSNTIQKYLSNKNLSGPMAAAELGGVHGKIAASIRDMLIGRYRGASEKLLRDALLNVDDPEVQALLKETPSPKAYDALSKKIHPATWRRIKALVPRTISRVVVPQYRISQQP